MVARLYFFIFRWVGVLAILAVASILAFIDSRRS